MRKYRTKFNKQVTGFSEDALSRLCRYDFPGNVRELENLIERALILTTGTRIEAGEWLPQLHFSTSELTKLEQFERAEIKRLIELHQGNLAQVAKGLGISRTTLWRRLRDYQIQVSDDPPVSE